MSSGLKRKLMFRRKVRETEEAIKDDSTA